MTTFHVEFPNFMLNLETREYCETLKTVTGQYGSSTVLQQVSVQSDTSVSFLVYTLLLVKSWITETVKGCDPQTTGEY